jgi:hypothetical protein
MILAVSPLSHLLLLSSNALNLVSVCQLLLFCCSSLWCEVVLSLGLCVARPMTNEAKTGSDALTPHVQCSMYMHARSQEATHTHTNKQ